MFRLQETPKMRRGESSEGPGNCLNCHLIQMGRFAQVHLHASFGLHFALVKSNLLSKGIEIEIAFCENDSEIRHVFLAFYSFCPMWPQ